MDLYAKLTSCMEELSSNFSSRMTQYEEDLKNASGEATHKTVASLSKDFTEFKCLIWKTMSALKLQMELLVTGLDRHEMASRTKVLLLHGLEGKDEELLPGLLNVLTDKMEIEAISAKDIASCHRLGSDTNRPRPVLIRFENRAMKSVVWRNKSKLKSTGLTLSEFLTKPRHDVFMDARKAYGMKQCWTSEGKIVIQVSDKVRRKIESAAELRQLLAQFPVHQVTPVVQEPQVARAMPDKRVREPAK